MYHWQPKIFSIVIAFIAAFSNKGFVSTEKVIGQPVPQCNPVGLVLSSGDRQIFLGNTLCQGDKLNIQPGREVQIYCISNGQKLVLSGTTANFCPEKQDAIDERYCSQGDLSNCPKTKGPGEARKPTLISPYITVQIDGRPTLEWHLVVGATSYTVYVSGRDVDWSEKVETTNLPYPKAQPELQYGNTYKIVVVANTGDSAINDSVIALTMLPKVDVEQLQNTAQRIESLNLSKSEEAFYLDSLYMSRSLLDRSINLLKTQVADNHDPRLHRILGDRYLEAGIPTLAQGEYEQAKAGLARLKPY